MNGPAPERTGGRIQSYVCGMNGICFNIHTRNNENRGKPLFLKLKGGDPVQIIYHCFGGAHSSVTAAAIHLGILPATRLPTTEELLNTPYFDEQQSEDHGILRTMGRDEWGHQIFIVGRRGLKNDYPRLVLSFASILGIPFEELLVVNTITCVNYLMVFGGYSSRCLGFVNLGRPIVIQGIRRSYPRFVRLVSQIKTNIRKRQSVQ